MIVEYKTILQPSVIELFEKKSRFIGYAKPVQCEEEAIEFVTEIKQKHRDATHNVYAYVTRKDNINRFTDDGEPSGTAGLPTLDAIRKANFTDTAVVVTRYFGGILLGTGGLVKAYSSAASEAIAAAGPVLMRLSKIYSIICSYDLLGNIQHSLKTDGYITEDTIFTDKVEIIVGVPSECGESLEKSMMSVTNGRVKITQKGEKFVNTEYF
ncbi:MAG: YigZ family protein [Bacillota bacterium]|nr:YigZ family protein [Bacillota bacterium]